MLEMTCPNRRTAYNIYSTVLHRAKTRQESTLSFEMSRVLKDGFLPVSSIHWARECSAVRAGWVASACIFTLCAHAHTHPKMRARSHTLTFSFFQLIHNSCPISSSLFLSLSLSSVFLCLSRSLFPFCLCLFLSLVSQPHFIILCDSFLCCSFPLHLSNPLVWTSLFCLPSL